MIMPPDIQKRSQDDPDNKYPDAGHNRAFEAAPEGVSLIQSTKK